MKLKKLLPLASIAGVAAVVAPLVTSCGTKTYKYVFDEENTADEWKPKNQIAASTETKIYVNKATEAYFADVNKNKEILADDIVYGLLETFKPAADEGYIEEGKCDVKIGNLDAKTGKASFGYDLDLTLRTSVLKTESLKYFVDVQNVEYIVTYNSSRLDPDQYSWMAVPYITYLVKERAAEDNRMVGRLSQIILNYLHSNSDWSITFTLDIPFELEKETRITINSKSSDEVLEAMFAGTRFTNYLALPYLWYFANVEPMKEPTSK